MQVDSMLLETGEPNCFVLEGPVTFDNAADVAAAGEKTLSRALAKSKGDHWSISLSQLALADSSALSVFLSWMRFAQNKKVSLCFTDIPPQLEALAKVSDVYDVIRAATCNPLP